jgi:predicted AAA+ superfamily ATPase
MKRAVFEDLQAWLVDARRKPLVLRGARQVGKTWLVRELARERNLALLEVNLERDPMLARSFDAADPRRVFGDLALLRDHRAAPADSLLFIDEIQAAPEVLARLRWFAEEMPELPVVAAGSLLEFALADFSRSMPVGRVSYAYVEPLGFPEYLTAHGQDPLRERLHAWQPGVEISSAVHDKAWEWFDRYQMVGGMPAVVAAETQGADAKACRDIQRDLLHTYQDDFSKYAGRTDTRVLRQVLLAVVASLGEKFVYSAAGEGVKLVPARRSLEMLAAARLCKLIPHTAANGLPLAAEKNDRLRKAALLDVGLAHALWNTPALGHFPRWESLAPGIRGALGEQMAAQQLHLLSGSFTRDGQLFHWRREGGRAGEIDYLLELHGAILPVEVKSGAAGSMKSLHQFMYDKRLPLALRLDRNPPSLQAMEVSTTQGQAVSYSLLNLPHYLCAFLGGIPLGLSDPRG